MSGVIFHTAYSAFKCEVQLAGRMPSWYYWGMVDYDRIVRECFWDSSISGDEIRKIVMQGDLRRKKQLFERILLGSSRYLHDLQLFDREDLRILLEEYKLPEFNHDYAFRRKNISEVFFFDKELKIGELKWTA